MFIDLAPLYEIGISATSGITDLLSLLGAKIERFHSTVLNEFGPNGVYVLILFSLFIFTIIIIYIKSVIDTFQATDENTEHSKLLFIKEEIKEEEGDEEEYENDEENEDASNSITSNQIASDDDDNSLSEDDLSEEELKNMLLINREKELSRQLVKSSETTDDILNLKKILKLQSHKASENQHLDWDKNTKQNTNTATLKKNLFYQHPCESLSSLVCLIINMLSRNISTEKIAQVVYTRNNAKNSKEDILQIIHSVRDFIGICNSGHFDFLPNRQNLPLNDEALYLWAMGDNSACLILLENLIQQQITYADKLKGPAQEIAYAQASTYACIFGTIASLSNTDLATSSFELALDLTPKSINAWSRCADMYWLKHNYEDAVFAYHTVIENGDEFMYAEQKANANNKLASYYTGIGKTDKAIKLQAISNDYYRSTGIATDLTDMEHQALNIIEQGQNDNLQASIVSLLQNQQSL